MMRFDIPEAGPSSVPFTLGPPISPTFNVAGKRLTSVEEDSHEDWEGSVVEAEVDDQRDQELLEQFPTTPKSRVNRSTSPRPPMRPPRSPRRSLESLLIHSSMGEDTPLPSSSTAGRVQQEWLKQDPRPRYRRAHSSSKSLSGRSSWSSSHQSEIPPPSPSEQYRSRVSLDATPIIPSADTDFATIIEESPRRSMETSVSITDEHTMSRATPQRLPSTKRTRFLEAPDMSRSEQGASSDTNLSRRSYMSAFAGEDNGEWYAEEHRTPVDETLRSAPGVIGLGEGWAGGPQPRSKKNWFKRRPTPPTSDEDPLSLWTQSNELATHEASASQLRNMWNRSKRNLFGASSSALHDQQDRAGMSSEGEERPASRLRGLFSLSRSNIVSPTPDSGALPRPQSSPIKTRSKRFSLGIFSSSEVALSGPQQARHIIPPSPSMSVLPLAEEIKPHRQRQYSNAALARSEGDLSSLSESIPRRTSSLKRRQGPQPPWRPNSLLVTGRPQTPFIAEVDEAIRTSGSSTSVDTPQFHETSGTSSSKRRGHALTRTATFGLDDIASEQMIDQEHNLDQQQRDHSPVTPRMASWVHLPSKSVSFGHQVEDQSDVNQPPTMPNRRPSLGKRSASLFKKMRNVLPSALRQRSESGSIVKARSLARSQSMKTPDSSQSQSGNTTPSLVASTGSSSSREVRMEPLKSSSDSSDKTTTRHRRQSSWMIRSSSSLAKRLSRLTEQEEVEPEQSEGWNRNAPAGQDHDAQEAKNSRHQRRKSTNFAILTSFGAKRENKPHPLENIQRFPGSASMPALHRFASSELNLEIDLGDTELGLDDILEQGRRASVLHDLGHGNKPVPRTREEALEATAAALSGRIAQPGSPKRSNHTRNSSAPHASPSPSYKARSRARHDSLTLDSRSSAFISDIDMESHDRPRRNTSSVASSPCSTLTTPRHPHEHAPFTNSLTFVEGSGESTSLIIPRSPQLRKTSRSGSDERPVFNPPWGASAAPISRIGSNSGLQVPKRCSTATRMSMDSYITQPSLYDTDEVVESHAIKVTSLEDMQRKASVISLDALGERGLWNGGLQMSGA